MLIILHRGTLAMFTQLQNVHILWTVITVTQLQGHSIRFLGCLQHHMHYNFYMYVGVCLFILYMQTNTVRSTIW